MTDTASQDPVPPSAPAAAPAAAPAPSPSSPFDPVIDLDEPYIRFCGRISNIPPDAAEVVLSGETRQYNGAIHVEGWPELYELIALSGEIFGRLTLTHGVTTERFVARLMMPQPGKRAIVLLSDAQEKQLTDLWFSKPPARLPAGLRSLSADLAADDGSPLPPDLRSAMARTARLFSDVIELLEAALELPCGTVALRIEALTFAGHVDLLTRSLRAGHALLEADLPSLRGGVESAMTALSRMLDVLTKTLATPQATKGGAGASAPAPGAAPVAAAEQPSDPL